MDKKLVQELKETFGDHNHAARALGMTPPNYLVLRSSGRRIRKPYLMLLEYFQHDPEQFKVVSEAVDSGVRPSWKKAQVKALHDALERLSEGGKVDEGADLTT